MEPHAFPWEELDPVQRAYRAGDLEEVKEWIVENWQEVA